MTKYLEYFWRYWSLIAPWIFLGILLAYIVEKKVDKKYLKVFSGGLTLGKLLWVSVLGMISPLSVLSFLPVAGELTAKGVNSGLLLSFFIAERAYDSQSFFVIASLFGFKMAIFNALAILVSLIVTALFIKNEKVKFVKDEQKKKNSFWYRQLRVVVVVWLGILLAAGMRMFFPEQLISNYFGHPIKGILSILFLGFVTYLGPVMSNYPVAKALSELGMTNVATLIYLTVSPILNLVVITMFGAAVGLKTIIKPVVIYIVVSLSLGLLFGSL